MRKLLSTSLVLAAVLNLGWLGQFQNHTILIRAGMGAFAADNEPIGDRHR